MSLGTVYTATSPTLNDPFDWYTRLKLRQQSVQNYFRLPVLQNYANGEKNMLRMIEATGRQADQRGILELAKQDSGEFFKKIVEKPIKFNENLLERVKNANAVDNDDNDSVVSDTLSVDEKGDPAEYKEVKASIKDKSKEFKATQKAGQAIIGRIQTLEAKAVKGKLTEKESATLEKLKDHAISLAVYSHKAVPQLKADLKALKKSAVRDVLRSHLQKSSGAAEGNEEEKAKEDMAKLLAGSSLKVTTDGDLWWHGAKVDVNKLNKNEAERISKVLYKKLETVDLSEDSNLVKSILMYTDAIAKRLQQLQKKKVGTGAGASASSEVEEPPSSPPSPSAPAALSAAPSRAVSPAPPETEAEDEEGGGDGKPRTIKIKRAASGAGSATAEKKVVKVDDKLFMNTVGTSKEVYLSGKKVTTKEEYQEVLDKYAGNKSEEAIAVINYIRYKLKKL